MGQITESRFDRFLHTRPGEQADLFNSPTCKGADPKWYEFLYYFKLNPGTGEIRDFDNAVVAQYFDAPVSGISEWLADVPDQQNLRILVFNPEGHTIPDVWTHEHNALVMVKDGETNKALLAVLRKSNDGEFSWTVRRPVRRGREDYQQEAVQTMQTQLAEIKAVEAKGFGRIQSFRQWHASRPQRFVTYGK